MNNLKQKNFSFQMAELALAFVSISYLMLYPRDTILDFIVFTILCIILNFFSSKLGLFKPIVTSNQNANIYLMVTSLLLFLSALVYAFLNGSVNTNSIIELLSICLAYFYYAFIQHYLTQRYLAQRVLQFNNKFKIHQKINVSPELSAALITGLVFGVLHIPYPVLIIPSMFGGFLYTYYFLLTGRLWAVVISHALISSIGIFWLLGENPFTELAELFNIICNTLW